MNKADFILRVSSMETPELSKESGTGTLLSAYWVVRDGADIKNKFCTPEVKMNFREYLFGNYVAYRKREKMADLKYHRWLKEAKNVT